MRVALMAMSPLEQLRRGPRRSRAGSPHGLRHFTGFARRPLRALMAWLLGRGATSETRARELAERLSKDAPLRTRVEVWEGGELLFTGRPPATSADDT